MKTVVGIFKTLQEATQAANLLKSAGFDGDHVILLSPGAPDVDVEAAVPTEDAEQPGMGKAIGSPLDSPTSDVRPWRERDALTTRDSENKNQQDNITMRVSQPRSPLHRNFRFESLPRSNDYPSPPSRVKPISQWLCWS